MSPPHWYICKNIAQFPVYIRVHMHYKNHHYTYVYAYIEITNTVKQSFCAMGG